MGKLVYRKRETSMTDKQYDALCIEHDALLEDYNELLDMDKWTFQPYQVTLNLIKARIDEIATILAKEDEHAFQQPISELDDYQPVY